MREEETCFACGGITDGSSIEVNEKLYCEECYDKMFCKCESCDEIIERNDRYSCALCTDAYQLCHDGNYCMNCYELIHARLNIRGIVIVNTG